jgi:hypothetical protein
MQLKLLINDEEKIFSTPFVSGMVLRKYLELQAKRENPGKVTVAEMDEYVGLVVYAFKNQFTLEDFYDGIPQDQIWLTVDSLFAPTGGNETDNKKK